MKKIFAFTLAEVLITMSVIGIVAAMTIPTLNYNRMKREYTAKLKNFYSHMDNAIVDMQIDKGSIKDIPKPGTGKHWAWYLEYIDPFMGHQYVNSSKSTVYFKDGSSLILLGAGNCLDVDYDVNGDKGPNSLGYDKYRFLYCFDNVNKLRYFGNEDIFFGTYGDGLNKNVPRSSMLSKCANTSTRTSCTRLLQNDQWEFKSDYPLKF